MGEISSLENYTLRDEKARSEIYSLNGLVTGLNERTSNLETKMPSDGSNCVGVNDTIACATNADNATHADNATNADNATHADNATNADNATHADNATNADNATCLAGKSAEYYTPVRNLLDNSDFRNPVNQRGATSLTEVGYFIDRWATEDSDNPNLSLGDGYVTVTNGHITQRIPDELIDPEKTYTIAAMSIDGTLLIDSAKASEEPGSMDMGISMGYSYDMWRFYIFRPGSYIWAALYEGEYTADNLPPYIPKGYAAELAECDLYYRPLGDNVMNVVCMTTSDGGNVIFKSIRPMRDNGNPTIINNGTLYVRVNGVDYTGTDVRISKSDKSGVEILITADSAPAKQVATLHGSALLALSRDL